MLPFFRPRFQHQLCISGWQNVSFRPAPSKCCSVFFTLQSQVRVCFLTLPWLCGISLLLQEMLQAGKQKTPCLQQLLVQRWLDLLGSQLLLAFSSKEEVFQRMLTPALPPYFLKRPGLILQGSDRGKPKYPLPHCCPGKIHHKFRSVGVNHCSHPPSGLLPGVYSDFQLLS